jgi:thymidylate kinase
MTHAAQSHVEPQTAGFNRLVTAAFAAWKQARVDFLVLRNYELLPQATANDIDILVAREQLELAERTLLGAAQAVGYRLHNRAEFATRSLYFADLESGGQIHFDLFVDLRWHSFEYLSCRNFLARKVERGLFWIPHPAHEACTNLLASLIYSGRIKDKYKPGVATAFRVHANGARDLLASSYGPAIARRLVLHATKEEWSAIESQTRKLRAILLLRLFTRRPWPSLATLAKDVVRWIERFFQPPGLMVVLLGPDGCGKSTITRAVSAGLDHTFDPSKSVHYHWKPQIFPRLGQNTRGDVTDPHGSPPRNRVLSLLFFGFHWLEFCLGSVLRLRPALARGGLVLIERYYYDFFVDRARYRLQLPESVARWAARLVKKPDLALLLDAPVEVLRARKQEVSLEETARQQQAYRQLVARLPNGVVLDAAQAPDIVTADAVKAILNRMTVRASRRARGQRKVFPLARGAA